MGDFTQVDISRFAVSRTLDLVQTPTPFMHREQPEVPSSVEGFEAVQDGWSLRHTTKTLKCGV